MESILGRNKSSCLVRPTESTQPEFEVRRDDKAAIVRTWKMGKVRYDIVWEGRVKGVWDTGQNAP